MSNNYYTEQIELIVSFIANDRINQLIKDKNKTSKEMEGRDNKITYIENIYDLGNMTTTTSYSTNSIETGRVEKGGKSNQKFEEVDMDFEKFHISSIVLQLLPESVKPVETKDLKKEKSSNPTEDIIGLIKNVFQKAKVFQLRFKRHKVTSSNISSCCLKQVEQVKYSKAAAGSFKNRVC